MTANLLTLNDSKTEFLLLEVKQQLSKIQNSALSTTHFARNLGFIFDEHRLSGRNLCFFEILLYHIHELCCRLIRQ